MRKGIRGASKMAEEQLNMMRVLVPKEEEEESVIFN